MCLKKREKLASVTFKHLSVIKHFTNNNFYTVFRSTTIVFPWFSLGKYQKTVGPFLYIRENGELGDQWEY